MPMVHTCAQLYAARCLWVGPVGVARFTKISRGRGQVLVKNQAGLSQGSRLKMGSLAIATPISFWEIVWSNCYTLLVTHVQENLGRKRM